MSMVINHNMMAINTQRQFSSSANGMSSAMEKLSSGLKINTGKDDPSGLHISEQLRSQIAGLERAKTNTEEAMNVMSIAEGAMNEMNSILKKMKALAVHANSDGVTTPDQIAADQAEMDSSIQTIDRIAKTTKFSGEQLINGNKDITYEQNVSVRSTQNNKMLNARESSFSQIFKREGYEVTIGFGGACGTVGANGVGTGTNFAAQAMKAYFEVDTQGTSHASDLKNNHFSHDQQFTVTGNKGSRQVDVAKGQHVGTMVNAINAATDATGVAASLVFNSSQTTFVSGNRTVSAATLAGTTSRVAADAHVFNNATNSNKIISVAPGASTAVLVGRDTDGQGKVYIKYTGAATAELYKDSSLSEESKVGSATANTAGTQFTVQSINGSSLNGLQWNIQTNANIASLTTVKGTYIAFGGLQGGGAVPDPTATPPVTNTTGIESTGDLFGAGNGTLMQTNVLINGVELGKNTDGEGKIYLKTVKETNASNVEYVQVFAYNHKDMNDENLVAQSSKNAVANSYAITLNEIRNDDQTAGTGLGIVLSSADGLDSTADGTYKDQISFSNLGARIYAEEYGDDQYVKITQDKGQSISYYKTGNDAESRTMITAGETVKQSGQNATLSVNGRQVTTDGLKLKVATQDIQADFTFNAGKSGSTTLAQVGYGEGTAFTGIGALTVGVTDPTQNGDVDDNISSYIANAGHNSSENIENFEGGMQLQLGESAGSNDRTVVAIKSMLAEELGRVTKTGMYEKDGKPIYTERTFTMKDMLSGGAAALAQDASLAMEIVEKSINDVAEQRALLGAMQANLLQTNSNNLSVTIENVTKTESGIRDADMAVEMTEFTKQQVLQNAAMSMMGQANQASQSALQLLR